MADIVSTRETFIWVTEDGGLYPSNHIFPSDDLYPRDAGLKQVTNIVAGSLKLEGHICEKIPQLGQLYASKFECQVYLEEDLKGKYIQVYQSDNGVERTLFSLYKRTIKCCSLVDRILAK